MRCPTFFSTLLLAGGFLFAGSEELAGQMGRGVERDFSQGMTSGIGYSGVLPDAMLGVGAWRLFPELGFGLFVDAKRSSGSVEGLENYCPPATRPPNLERCTVETVQRQWPVDFPLRDVEEYRIVNAGVIRPLTSTFAILGGVGAARRHVFREFTEMIPDDEDWRVSDYGAYYAPLTEAPEWGIQGVVGILLRAGNHLVFRAGYETAPGGFGVGVYLAF
jgi:hypothetical protein